MAVTAPPPLQVPLYNPRGKLDEVWQRYFVDLQRDLDTGTAPADAQFLTATSDPALTNERNLGALASGYLKITTAAGVATPSTVTTIPQADVTGLAASLALLAPLASPSFTGTVASAGLVDLSGAGAGQIKFPATQNASANANTLDDYEEGTWTPVDGSGASLTFTGVSAVYTKIGRVVFVAFALVYPVTANGNVASVAGLPFTSGANQYALTTIYTDYGAGILHYIGAGLSAIGFYTLAAVAITNANLSGKIMRASGVYFV